VRAFLGGKSMLLNRLHAYEGKTRKEKAYPVAGTTRVCGNFGNVSNTWFKWERSSQFAAVGRYLKK
jgi:hypothetical protein